MARGKPTITAASLVATAQVSHAIDYSGGTGLACAGRSLLGVVCSAADR
jgi:hypothetical protein